MRPLIGAAAMAVLMGACSDASSPRTPAPAPTTQAVETSSSSSSTTTTLAPATSTTARPTTTAPARLTPEATAKALYAAWVAADRAAAAKVAEPAAADALFARRWQAADGWAFSECTGAAGSVICTWRRPTGEELLMRVQNVTGGLPVTVADLRFAP